MGEGAATPGQEPEVEETAEEVSAAVWAAWIAEVKKDAAKAKPAE